MNKEKSFSEIIKESFMLTSENRKLILLKEDSLSLKQKQDILNKLKEGDLFIKKNIEIQIKKGSLNPKDVMYSINNNEKNLNKRIEIESNNKEDLMISDIESSFDDVFNKKNNYNA